MEPELVHRNAEERRESDSPLLDGTKNSIPLSLLSSIPALSPAISQAVPNVTSFVETPWSTTLSPVPVQEFSSGYMYLVSPAEKKRSDTQWLCGECKVWLCHTGTSDEMALLS